MDDDLICLKKFNSVESNLNIIQKGSGFRIYLTTNLFYNFLSQCSCLHHRSSYLDNEWFSFETASTLVVGWDGGPSRGVTRQDETRPSNSDDPVMAHLQQLDLDGDHKPRPSAIEVAALVTVGGYNYCLLEFFQTLQKWKFWQYILVWYVK